MDANANKMEMIRQYMEQNNMTIVDPTFNHYRNLIQRNMGQAQAAIPAQIMYRTIIPGTLKPA